MTKTTDPYPDIEFDPDTNLPKLPDALFWRIEATSKAYHVNNNGEEFWYRGPTIMQKTAPGLWSDWFRGLAKDNYDIRYNRSDSQIEERVVEYRVNRRQHFFSPRREVVRKRNEWRHRIRGEVTVLFVHTSLTEPEILTAENMVQITVDAYRAWDAKRRREAVYGDYPPMKAPEEQK